MTLTYIPIDSTLIHSSFDRLMSIGLLKPRHFLRECSTVLMFSNAEVFGINDSLSHLVNTSNIAIHCGAIYYIDWKTTCRYLQLGMTTESTISARQKLLQARFF